MGKLDEFILKDKISETLCEKACADLKTLGPKKDCHGQNCHEENGNATEE